MVAKLQWREISLHLPAAMWGIKPTISGDSIIIVGYCSIGGCSKEHYQITIDEIISLDQPLSTGAVVTKWKKMHAFCKLELVWPSYGLCNVTVSIL